MPRQLFLPVDAAVHWPDGLLYFFKGTDYFAYRF
ncbi:MAG: hypothetical protein HY744_30580 [Deltaproteobacteria bacterium]|nr:hypothetical protein [Deltaproteobacteria bacterium]